MKKVLLGMLLLTTLFLSGCTETKEDSSDKTTPVYQGMELSNQLGTLYVPTSVQPTRLSNVFLTTGDDEPIDEEIIIEETETIIGVLTSEEVSFYAQKNEALFITVNILNPDSFEILSFTLNGYKYQSYQFEDGSDSEQLVLEVNSDDISGIKEFTIDQIKYVDGTDIKDVVIDGNKTIKLGVEYETPPLAIITNENIGTTFISFDVNLTDEYGLIVFSNTNAKAVLYYGEEIIQEFDLIIGDNEVKFGNLSSLSNYQYAIVAAYDLMDSNGTTINVLSAFAFTTHNFIEVTNVVTQQETITFELDITDTDTVGSLTSVELYQGETLIEALTDLTIREFTGLLSNNEYTIKATYIYDLNDGLGVQTAQVSYTTSTLAKATPTIEATNVITQQETITFNLDITDTDTDTVGTLTSIELYQGETLIESLTDLTVREFTGLLSNNEYTIKATYTYDLNDGVGVQTEETIRTINTRLFDGFGTAEDPYLIRNFIDFDNIRYLSDSHYLFVNNINMSNNEWTAINQFSGVIDGNGFSMDNLSIDFCDENSIFIGLINTNYGVIKNLTISNATFYGTTLNDIDFGVIAYSNIGLIEDVEVIIEIDVISYSSVSVGGISSINHGSIIESNVHMVSNILSATESIIGGITAINRGDIVRTFSNINIINVSQSSEPYSGGIAGILNTGSIKDTYSTGFIHSKSNSDSITYAGGIAGYTYSSLNTVVIDSTYFYGDVIAETGWYRASAGGITGQTYSIGNGDIIVKNSIFFANVTSNGDSVYRAGRITGDIRVSSSTVLLYNNLIDASFTFTNTSGYTGNPSDIEAMGIDEVSTNIDASLFTEILLWDDTIWDISTLDSTNGIYPTLIGNN